MVLVDEGLAAAVDQFIDRLGAVLAPVERDATGGADSLQNLLALEAYNLCAGFIDSDGAHSDTELWAFIAALGQHFPDIEPGRVTAGDLRASGLMVDKRRFLDAPSDLLGRLATLDARSGSHLSTVYYEQALGIAYTVVGIDGFTSRLELGAVERFRAMVRSAMAAGGDPAPAGATVGAGPSPNSVEPASDDPPPRPLDELLDELDQLIGLTVVKEEVRLVAALVRVQELRRERGLPVHDSSRHLVFTGNPGTGKSTVARLLAQIYRTLGVVERGHLVETDRSGLVAGFVGQTATKVTAVFDRADEGVLIIDEAYSLVRGGERDFGREAIDTIVKLVEDRRERIVVVMAGYPDEMAQLVAANPGLRSRFPKTITFPDYTDAELVAIFELIAGGAGYRLDDLSRETVRRWFGAQPRRAGFGNGRTARNLFEAAVARHATRVVDIDDPTDDDLAMLTVPDIPPGDALAPLGSGEDGA